MRTGLLLAGWAVSGTALGAVATAAEAAKALEGTWRAVSAWREGTPAEDLQGHRLTFDGDRFVIRSATGTVLYRGTLEVVPAKTPPTIDSRHESGPHAGTTWRGVYQLEGKTLRICDNAVDPEQPRPTRLDSKPGSGTVLITFEWAMP